MEHQQKSLARLAPAQGFTSIFAVRQNYNTLDAECEFLAEKKGGFGGPASSSIPIHGWHLCEFENHKNARETSR